MIKGLDYWYDGQMRRFMEQIVRAFSGFKYQTGARTLPDGTIIPPQLKLVPCKLASTDRLVAQLVKNGSDNVILSAPMITVYMSGLQGRRGDVQNLAHTDTRVVTERAIDPETQAYTGARGRSYSVVRPMPRPFEMIVQVDIWTSNLDQKHQLAEQILTVIYPNFSIQNSDNALDWTALSEIHTDDINWTSRSVPIGQSDEIDILTLTLKLPFWLSPPVKIQQQRIIEQIVTNIYDARTGEELTSEKYLTRNITTPGLYSIQVSKGKITLLGPKSLSVDENGRPNDWSNLLDLYGELRPAVSRLHLRMNPDLDDVDHDITGTIQLDAHAPNEIFWQVDLTSLPENTQAPVDAIIDPRQHFPGELLPGQRNGQRYLVIESITGTTQAWGGLSANRHDIIAYANGQWSVDFRPAADSGDQYVLNNRDGRQLRWTGTEWIFTIDGTYAPGMWRLHL